MQLIGAMKHLLLILFFGILSACGKESSDKDITIIDKEEPENSDFLPGEIKPIASIDCFAGAYYRKAVSSKDKWRGISAKVVLPQIFYDPDRLNPVQPGQYLDNFSVYLGGNAGGQETDIGLTWEVIRDAQGNVTADRRAFRPFWRTADIDGYPGISWANAEAKDDYYFYPGDTLIMSIKLIADKTVQFDVIGLGPIAHKHFSVPIECRGFTSQTNGEYKRVNAIDQVANEGKPVQATKAKTEGTEWLETNLFRLEGSEIIAVPMHSGRFTDMRCPSASYIKITATDEDKKIGAEKVNIYGTPFFEN